MTTAVSNLVAWIKGKMQTAAGIASPSRLFAEVGQNISAGVAVGIGEGIPTVDAALGDLFSLVQPLGPSMTVTAERDLHIYLHADGLRDLSPTGRQELAGELARQLKIQGLRAGIA
jgi:hypothetical protein